MIQSNLLHYLILGAVCLTASVLSAQTLPPDKARLADVVFIGEQHDNPGHHALQAEWVQSLEPAALVFEMLTPAQAQNITSEDRQVEETLSQVLEWENSGWPDFAMYFPIFAAAPEAAILGAGVPRDQVRGMIQRDEAEVFGAEDAARFGLDEPLPADQQAEREALQARAHCDALPEDLLPMMVSVQRMRDATLARAALDAHQQTGGPVVVITGNGHARADWGAPHYLQQAAPDLVLFALAQGEEGSMPDGLFDATVDGPKVDRGNPCDAFN